MFERFERPLKILCLALAAVLVWQLASVILRGDPLANLKIPALPTLPGATNDTAKRKGQKETNSTPWTQQNPWDQWEACDDRRPMWPTERTWPKARIRLTPRTWSAARTR